MKKIPALIALIIFVTTDLYAQQWTTSGSNIYNSNTGNVGVGSTSPLEKLHVQNGNVLISDNSFATYLLGTLKFSTTTYNYAWAGLSGNTNGQGWDQVDLLFYTAFGAPSEKMRLMANTGYLGIGTSTPAAKLDVNGNIFSNGKIAIGTTDLVKIGTNSLAVNGSAIFTKAKVAVYATAWPDYVFDPSYKMTTLDSLELFIQLNKHLPEIPSGEDVEKNGLDLGDTQALLLKKIEELTLIVIEQNKRFNALQKDFDEMKSKLSKN